jgi:hypothetical protein
MTLQSSRAQPTGTKSAPVPGTVMKKRILFVAYGGGHVKMVIPVVRRLRENPAVEVSILGLTTAHKTLEAAGLPSFGFRHVLTKNNRRAREMGERLAAALGPGLICPEETVAYLGLCYADLETRLGPEEAARRYAVEGRQAFLPLTVFERIFREQTPNLVIATNSPRAERAALEVAGQAGLPSACLVDLFALHEVKWIGRPGYANRVCVLSDFVKQIMLKAGRQDQDVVVTGNPAFDVLADPSLQGRGLAHRQARGWGKLRMICWASQPEPERHPFTGQAGNPDLPRSVDRELFRILQSRPDWGLVLRPHPSEKITWSNLPERTWVSGADDHLPTLLNAVDVVVTMSSTVGLEAALLGRPVVTLENSVISPDAPYAAMGIALGVPNVAGLAQGLVRVLDHGWQPPMRIDGPGRATDRVLEVLEGLLHLNKIGSADHEPDGTQRRAG